MTEPREPMSQPQGDDVTHYCTYFDVNYLTRGLALHESLKRHAGQFVLWVLCLDEAAHDVLASLAQPTIRLVRLAELEAADPALLEAKQTRSIVEYYFTLTPALPLHVLRAAPNAQTVTYLDADLLFYSSPARVFDELGDGSVLIVPHRFPPELRHLEVHGVYNVGLLTFRRDEHGLAILERWRSQCLQWCYDRVEDGKFGDQAYLDEWPAQPGVVVSEDPGVGLAPWNVMRYDIDTQASPPLVDGHPLVFYHFQGVKEIRPHVWDIGLDKYGTTRRRTRSWLYGGYVRALRDAARRVERQLASRPGAQTLRVGEPVRWRRVLRRALRGQIIVTLD